MSQPVKYNVILADPDSELAGRFRQVTVSLNGFNKVYVANSLNEAFSMAGSGKPVDLVVLSYRFSEESIREFIEKLKKHNEGKEWAIMAVHPRSDDDSVAVASGIMDGINGFLFEPYCAENVREMCDITAKVKWENDQSRHRAAIQILVKEMSVHVDAMAVLLAGGRAPNVAMKRLRKVSEKIARLKGELYETYVDVLTDTMEQCQPTVTSYDGPSKRLKEKIKEKQLQKIAEEYAEEPEGAE